MTPETGDQTCMIHCGGVGHEVYLQMYDVLAYQIQCDKRIRGFLHEIVHHLLYTLLRLIVVFVDLDVIV